MELPLPINAKIMLLSALFAALGHTASDIYAKLMEVCGNSMSYDIVKRWHREFLNGCMSTCFVAMVISLLHTQYVRSALEIL